MTTSVIIDMSMVPSNEDIQKLEWQRLAVEIDASQLDATFFFGKN